MEEIQVGQQAPDFELATVTGETKSTFKLSDCKGKNVVLVFYPLDFTPV